MEVILFNDLHMADNPPALRKEGYFEEGLAMLCEMVEVARVENACLVSSGDLFNLKDPKKNSLHMLGQMIDAIRPIGRMYVVPGNHDMNTRGSIEGQPLELLAKAGVVQVLTRGGWWLNGINVISRPYNMARDTDPSYYALDALDGTSPGEAVLMVAHGSIVPNDAIRPYPHIQAQQIDTTGIDVLASGHIHEDLGISIAKEGTLFMNLGSCGRVAHTDSNKTRHVKIAGIDKNSDRRLRITPYYLKSALPGNQIFKEPAPPVEGASRNEIEQFVAGLSTGLEMEHVDVTQLIKSLGLKPEIEWRILHYLEEVGG